MGRHWREASERGLGGKEKDTFWRWFGIASTAHKQRPPASDGPSSQRSGQGGIMTSKDQVQDLLAFPFAWEHMLLPARLLYVLPRAFTLTSL